MGNIEKIKPNLYVKELVDGSWRVVYPLKTDGKLNWKNIIYGGRISNIVTITAILFILWFMASSYANDTEKCREIIENPPLCCACTSGGFSDRDLAINFSTLNFIAKEEVGDELNISVSSQDNDKEL